MASDVDVIGAISAALRADYQGADRDPWLGSPFEWIHDQASRRKGAIGKKMFRQWALEEGFDVRSRPRGARCDCVVDGLKVVVKFGLLWAQGTLKFEQIRDEDYDSVALLGLEPDKVHLWVVPLDPLWKGSDEQHGPDTHWLTVRPAAPPAVLQPFGGTLAEARASLLEQAGSDRER
jgi:hypothetical protein